MESLTKKRKEYQLPRFMSVSEAAEQLLEIIRRKQGDHEELGMLQTTCVWTTMYLSLYQLHFSFLFSQPSSYWFPTRSLLQSWDVLRMSTSSVVEWSFPSYVESCWNVISVLLHELCTCFNSLCMLMSDLLFLHFYSV